MPLSARVLLVIVGVLTCQVAASFEQQLGSGLDVLMEAMAEPVLVNGMTFVIQRATGRDVPELARRIESRWRGQEGVVQNLARDGWSMRSRIYQGDSEVLQWHGTGRSAELLWSRTNLRTPAQEVPLPAFALPTGCAWTRTVHGATRDSRYVQSTARCSGDAADLRPAVVAGLRREGWKVSAADAGAILADRSGLQAQAVVAPASRGPWRKESAIVWLQVGARTEGSP